MEIFEYETYSVQTKPMQSLGKFLKRKTKRNNSKYVKNAYLKTRKPLPQITSHDLLYYRFYLCERKENIW